MSYFEENRLFCNEIEILGFFLSNCTIFLNITNCLNVELRIHLKHQLLNMFF